MPIYNYAGSIIEAVCAPQDSCQLLRPIGL